MLVLALTLGLAIYVVLFARESTRPAREAAVLRAEALRRDADLGAAQLDARLARARTGLTVASQALRNRPDRPLDALEAARRLAPNSAFALVEPGGAASAAVGAAPADFRPFAASETTGPRASHDRTALLTTAPQAAGLVARTPVSDAAGDRTLVVSPTEGLIAGAAGESLEEKLGMELAALTASETAVHASPSADVAVEAMAAPLTLAAAPPKATVTSM